MFVKGIYLFLFSFSMDRWYFYKLHLLEISLKRSSSTVYDMCLVRCNRIWKVPLVELFRGCNFPFLLEFYNLSLSQTHTLHIEIWYIFHNFAIMWILSLIFSCFYLWNCGACQTETYCDCWFIWSCTYFM